jgi:GNAT superfamily N-acetyltransferase
MPAGFQPAGGDPGDPARHTATAATSSARRVTTGHSGTAEPSWRGLSPPLLRPPPAPVQAPPSVYSAKVEAPTAAYRSTAARRRKVDEARLRWQSYPWRDDWLRLAEDLFWVMHRDRDGSLLVHPRIAGLGLAAALLSGLISAETLTIRDGLIGVHDRQTPDDGIALLVVTQMRCEPRDHPVRTWLDFLARDTYEHITRWLVRTGRLRTIERMLRSPRHEPVSMNDAAWPRARLSTTVGRRLAPDPFDTALIGLLFATDMDRLVFTGGDTTTVKALRGRVTETTPADVRAVLHALETAVATTVVTAT